ncbi:MAG: acyl-CoA/acyl-ACP dehydrogenase [Calditrichia bacterium]|nr:acyl-CoA/acyl-ACP dehydrogenase [Calditrichia bacterium]
MPLHRNIDPEMFEMILDSIDKLEKDKLPLETKLKLDITGEYPADLIRFIMGPEMGLHLLFISEEYGGLGASAYELAAISERMAKMDLAIATSLLVVCLGMDPIRVGSTEEQKNKYITRIAEEGLMMAYGVTEPDAGSNVQALKTRAERVLDDSGKIVAYKINGQKQFITNAAFADLFTILADTPEGPSFFIVESGTKGLQAGKHEDKHGIRASNTSPLILDNVEVPAENLVGGVEGQGLKQANEVFGYTRLMVAAFGLGGGMASLERVVKYSKERIQFKTTLSEKQGYTHKLIVPHAVRLEAARAYIEETTIKLDSSDEDFQVEGSIAKYFATEAGDHMANDGIQALGGYGYMREYEVEKIKRDIKILTIYEGTSEIQQNIIAMFRLRSTIRSAGDFYETFAKNLETLPEDTNGPLLAQTIRAMNDVIVTARNCKLTSYQYVLFLLADMMTWCEVANALCHKSSDPDSVTVHTPEYLKACARLFVRESIEKVYINGLKIVQGCDKISEEVKKKLEALNVGLAMKDIIKDMDYIASELVSD